MASLHIAAANGYPAKHRRGSVRIHGAGNVAPAGVRTTRQVRGHDNASRRTSDVREPLDSGPGLALLCSPVAGSGSVAGGRTAGPPGALDGSERESERGGMPLSVAGPVFARAAVGARRKRDPGTPSKIW